MTRVDLSGAAWRKASYSSGQGGNCVEVAALGAVAGLRDSKDPAGPVLLFTPTDFHAFVTAVKSDSLR